MSALNSLGLREVKRLTDLVSLLNKITNKITDIQAAKNPPAYLTTSHIKAFEEYLKKVDKNIKSIPPEIENFITKQPNKLSRRQLTLVQRLVRKLAFRARKMPFEINTFTSHETHSMFSPIEHKRMKKLAAIKKAHGYPIKELPSTDLGTHEDPTDPLIDTTCIPNSFKKQKEILSWIYGPLPYVPAKWPVLSSGITEIGFSFTLPPKSHELWKHLECYAHIEKLTVLPTAAYRWVNTAMKSLELVHKVHFIPVETNAQLYFTLAEISAEYEIKGGTEMVTNKKGTINTGALIYFAAYQWRKFAKNPLEGEFPSTAAHELEHAIADLDHPRKAKFTTKDSIMSYRNEITADNKVSLPFIPRPYDARTTSLEPSDSPITTFRIPVQKNTNTVIQIDSKHIKYTQYKKSIDFSFPPNRMLQVDFQFSFTKPNSEITYHAYTLLREAFQKDDSYIELATQSPLKKLITKDNPALQPPPMSFLELNTQSTPTPTKISSPVNLEPSVMTSSATSKFSSDYKLFLLLYPLLKTCQQTVSHWTTETIQFVSNAAQPIKPTAKSPTPPTSQNQEKTILQDALSLYSTSLFHDQVIIVSFIWATIKKSIIGEIIGNWLWAHMPWNKMHALNSEEIATLNASSKMIDQLLLRIVEVSKTRVGKTVLFVEKIVPMQNQLQHLTLTIAKAIDTKQASSAELATIKTKLNDIKCDFDRLDLKGLNKTLRQAEIKNNRSSSNVWHVTHENKWHLRAQSQTKAHTKCLNENTVPVGKNPFSFLPTRSTNVPLHQPPDLSNTTMLALRK